MASIGRSAATGFAVVSNILDPLGAPAGVTDKERTYQEHMRAASTSQGKTTYYLFKRGVVVACERSHADVGRVCSWGPSAVAAPSIYGGRHSELARFSGACVGLATLK